MKIEDAVKALFPSGYPTFGGPRDQIGSLPYLCSDLFAVAALLLQRSGAYHHVAPENQPRRSARTLVVTEDMRDRWVRLGEEWRGDGAKDGFAPPKELDELWERFWAHRNTEIYVSLGLNEPAPAWWFPALELMCIADEAATGIGFDFPFGARSFQAELIFKLMGTNIAQNAAQFSLSSAEPDLVCVLPKSRTPMLGCTLRSLSHHLALLPSQGLARAHWLPFAGPDKRLTTRSTKLSVSGTNAALNCLLIPLPYRISAQAFRGVRSDREKWGWFEVHPHWCPLRTFADVEQPASGFREFWEFVRTLILEAEKDVGKVHVLVFPELALGSAVFRKLKEKLEETNVELLVSGLFDSDETKHSERGNYAALAVVGENGLLSFRQKHHRWRLDRSQIQNYALGASLDPNIIWWEDLQILSRSLDVYVLRGTTTVTTLICEDLARVDPCQDLVRGIGPNLVFALLMDGPQLKARWPARYATVLAEDPGSSVLSFTSLGLVQRSNETGMLPRCRNIGLWRDDRGETVELSIGPKDHALCMSLHGTDFEEHTLDGRSDGCLSESWRLAGVQPVRAPSQTAGIAEILRGKWPRASSVSLSEGH